MTETLLISHTTKFKAFNNKRQTIYIHKQQTNESKIVSTDVSFIL